MVVNTIGRASLVGLCTALTLQDAKASAAPERDAYEFNIPAQDLRGALQAVALTANHKLFYRSDIAAGIRSPRLHGRLTVTEAMDHLLAGTGLTYEINHSNVVLIRKTRSSRFALQSVAGAALAVLAASGVPSGVQAQQSVAGAVEEVLVTARRREESLQDVPLAISALGNEALELRGIESAENLTSVAPNLRVQGGIFFGRSQGVFRMRGIPGVAVYVDGVVRSGANGALQNVVELERVEVLRGPQGTLFGKNAMGGAIQYVSQRPAEEFGARVKATVGSFDRADLTANIDIPLTETFLTKLTVGKFSRDGYMPSTTTDNALGSQDDTVVRGVALWRPSDVFNLTVIGEYAQQKSSGAAGTIWSLNPFCPGDPRPANYIGPGAPNGGCVFEAVGVNIDQGWLFGRQEEWKTASSYRGPEDDITTRSLTMEANWELTDAFSTKLLAGYRRNKFYFYHDFDATPLHIFEGTQTGEREERSAELQFQYAGDRLTGTSGFYYYRDEQGQRVINWANNELRFEPYLSARQALGGAYATFNPFIRDSLSFPASKGWAVFTEWTLDVTDKLALTAGARYNEDTISQKVTPPVVPAIAECCTPHPRSIALQGRAPLPNQSGEATFEELSPRVSIGYQWTDNIMTYLTYSQGFGAGGFTGGNIPSLPNGGFRAFGPETIDSYEFGIRADLLDRRLRLNATYFRGTYDDIQVSQERIPAFPETFNAGEADVEGIEIEGEWRIANAFTLNYGLAWLDTQFTDVGTAANLTLDTPFAWAPEYSYNVGAQYVWGVGQGGQMLLRGDYTWQDDVYTTTDVTTSSRQEAYGTLGGRLMYTSADGRWDVALIGSNLTNEYYRIGGFFIPTDQVESGTPARPREWGISFGFRFD